MQGHDIGRLWVWYSSVAFGEVVKETSWWILNRLASAFLLFAVANLQYSVRRGIRLSRRVSYVLEGLSLSPPVPW